MKRLHLLLVLVCLAIGAWAQQITEQQAMDRALQFLNTNTAAKARGLDGKQLILKAAKVEAKTIYAFNLEGGGYVIASGDERALPVLGYSDSGTIDWDRLPYNMREWLKSYDVAMATLDRPKGFKHVLPPQMKSKTRATKAAIEPLLKTHWNQTEPYWNKVPPYDGAIPYYKDELSLTGCAATAMAQVMNYHQWPKAACQEIPAYDIATEYEDEQKTWHIDGLPSTTFDWDHMLDNYWVYNPETNQNELVGTEAEQDAVATLMRYCGQAVKMKYSPEGSGSIMAYVSQALVKYFGYDGAGRCVGRLGYTIKEWENLIYEELAAGRPVAYGGQGDIGGHAFVCDGYDGNGLFHFNWGWGGYYDGYFSLSVLDPYIGLDTETYYGNGFCQLQNAVINVKPAPESTEPQKAIPTFIFFNYSPVHVIAPDTAVFQYYFYDLENKTTAVDFALGTCDDNGTLTPLFKGDPDDNIAYEYSINNAINGHVVKIDSTVFEPGEMQMLYPMLKFPEAIGDEWMLVGSKDYRFYAGRTAEGDFFLYSTTDLYNLEVTNVAFKKGNGYIGVDSELEVTFKNHGDTDFRQPVFINPLYFGNVKPEDVTWDTPYTQGNYTQSEAYLQAGKEAKASFSFSPEDVGTIYLYFCTYDDIFLGDFWLESEGIIGIYDAYVANNSYLEVENENNGEVQLGHAVYHVNFADIPGVTIPAGKPLDAIYAYARICDYPRVSSTEKALADEAYDYLCGLPEKAGDGSYQLAFDLDYDIRRGGQYYVRSYINVWLDETYTKQLRSSYQNYDFVVYDNPAIRVEGDTIVASGEPLDVKILLHSGYPYDPAGYSGAEKAQYTLYDVAGDGTLTERSSETVTLTFAQEDVGLAVVDTMTVSGVLPDGDYLLRVSSDVFALGTRYIQISVGSTGIDRVISNAPENKYFDLQGRRLQGRPARKGIYIRNNRKEVVR